MSKSIQDLCRESRDRQGMTNQDVADNANVPLSSVQNFFASASKTPTVNNSGNICRACGVSMDKYFDIAPDVLPEDQIEQLEHDHKAELVMANLEGRIEQLSKTEKRMRISLYSITIIAVVLLMTLIGYVVFDYQLPNVGLIQGRQASVAAWIVIILLAVGVGVIASAFLSALRYGKKIKVQKKRPPLSERPATPNTEIYHKINERSLPN